jgi:hypothetical protein
MDNCALTGGDQTGRTLGVKDKKVRETQDIQDSESLNVTANGVRRGGWKRFC